MILSTNVKSNLSSPGDKIFPTTDILLFFATRISFINLYDAISVEMWDLKPFS